MASGTQVNPIFAKHAAAFAKASAEVATEVPPVTVRGVLPVGIDNGVARLIEIKFGEFKSGENQGKPYAMPTASCVFPKSHGGVVTEGLYTSPSIAPIPLCDTGKPGVTEGRGRFTPMKDHFKELVFLVKRLMGWKPGDDVTPYVGNNLYATIAHLNGKRPTFRFKTWGYQKEEPRQLPNGKWAVFVGGQPSKKKPKSYPTLDALKADPVNQYIDREPKINHEWGEAVTVPDADFVPGAATEYDPPADEGHDGGFEPAADVEDDVVEVVPKPTPKPAPKPAPAAAPPAKSSAKPKAPAAAPPPPPPPVPEVEYSDDDDLASLGARADDGDTEAEKKLIEFAEGAGISKDGEGNYPGASWSELATLIAEGGGGGGDGDADVAVPQVGETWMTTVVRNGKKEKGEVEILTSAEGFVTAKDLVTGRPVKDPKAPKNNLKIPYADLEPVGD